MRNNKTQEPATERSLERPQRAARIAQRLAQLRREKDLSQDAVGQLVGASQATVSRWEDPDSLSTPSTLELAELAKHFSVDPAWLMGSREHRDELPEGQTVIDQALLDEFARAETAEDLERLLATEMTFGTIWVQIPTHAEIVSMQEAMRRVKLVDRRLRELHPKLWHEWARIVLG